MVWSLLVHSVNFSRDADHYHLSRELVVPVFFTPKSMYDLDFVAGHGYLSGFEITLCGMYRLSSRFADFFFHSSTLSFAVVVEESLPCKLPASPRALPCLA